MIKIYKEIDVYLEAVNCFETGERLSTENMARALSIINFVYYLDKGRKMHDGKTRNGKSYEVENMMKFSYGYVDEDLKSKAYIGIGFAHKTYDKDTISNEDKDFIKQVIKFCKNNGYRLEMMPLDDNYYEEVDAKPYLSYLRTRRYAQGCIPSVIHSDFKQKGLNLKHKSKYKIPLYNIEPNDVIYLKSGREFYVIDDELAYYHPSEKFFKYLAKLDGSLFPFLFRRKKPIEKKIHLINTENNEEVANRFGKSRNIDDILIELACLDEIKIEYFNLHTKTYLYNYFEYMRNSNLTYAIKMSDKSIMLFADKKIYEVIYSENMIRTKEMSSYFIIHSTNIIELISDEYKKLLEKNNKDNTLEEVISTLKNILKEHYV